MRKVTMLVAALALLVGTQIQAQEARLVARPLTPQEIVDYELPAGTQGASGLFTVGVGTAVYLGVQVLDGTTVVGDVTWGAVSGPGSATLVESPLAIGTVPPHIPLDRELYDVLSRKMLIPDAKGQWTVTAEVTVEVTTTDDAGVTTTSNEVRSLEVVITAGEYVGIANCSLCHSDVAAEWEKTGHSDMLVRGLNGTLSDHYGENCISCHTVGYNTAEGAVNGGFDDVAAAVGWEFPMEPELDADGNPVLDENGAPVEHPHLVPGTYDALPEDLKNVSNIQCESCHGPGSEHMGNKADNRISVSFSAGDCGQCHDSGTHHIKSQEWENSLHAMTNVDRGSASCNGCHSGIGFVELTVREKSGEAGVDWNNEHSTITCATCHDPHDATNAHQIRQLDDVTLGNGAVVTQGGYGKLCMSCHKGRRDIATYVEDQLGNPSSHFGPHHGPQTDMLAGENAYEFGQDIRKSTHLYAVENSCVGCHMPAQGTSDAAFLKAGGHTFWPSWDGGTPDDPSDDVDLTAACANCHGPMDSFDIPRDDYDGDGKVEGVQTEVAGLLDAVARALPPLDSPDIEPDGEYTEKQLQALFDYDFVLEDKSMGIHNTQYAVGLLRASVKALTGRTISSGGGVRVLATSADPGGLTASASAVGGSRELAGKLVPTAFGLAQNAPNPFNPETEIQYSVSEPGNVRIDIYNSVGQKVRTLVEAYHHPGVFAINWDGRDMDGQKVTAGVYIYTMQAGNFVEGKKMVLMP